MSTRGQGNQPQGRKRQLQPRSEVWEHFTRDVGNGTAKCKRCGKVYADHGTTNLQKHLKEGCGRQESADAGPEQPPQPLANLAQYEAMQQLPPVPLIPLPLPACAPSRHSGSSDRDSSGLQEEASKQLARMIALRGYDASVLEDDCFRSFVRRLNPEFEVPSRVAIEEMCDGIFDEAKRDLLDRLRRAPGKVNLAVGRTKTMEEEVLYVACHFIDDGWNLHKQLLHVTLIGHQHYGKDGQILGVNVYDGVKYVDVVIRSNDIGDRLFTGAYEPIDKDIHLEIQHYYSFGVLFIDNVLHSIARCLLGGDYFAVRCMEDLGLTRQGRLELFAELDLHYGLAYEEEWYSCYCSLKVVLCKKGFPDQCTEGEIFTTKLFCMLWEKIDRAIQKISSSTRPTANLCLAELFKLREILQSELARFSGGDNGYVYRVKNATRVLQRVLQAAFVTLDKAIEDSYLTWSLPLALDPRYKLEFMTFSFERAYGSEAAKEYVSKVRTMIMKLYAEYVEESGTTDGAHHSDSASAMDTTTGADNAFEQAWNERCRSQQAMTTQVSSCYQEAETELDRYLKDPPHDPQVEDFDILNWWKTHNWKYPIVARMARDALAIPTCSKLSSDQMAHVRSILRGYSKDLFRLQKESGE